MLSTWVLLLVLLLVSSSTTVDAKKKKKKPMPPVVIPIQSKHLKMCEGKMPLKSTNKKDMQRLSWLLQASGEGSILLESSPQHFAACWMLYEDRAQSVSRNQNSFLQRYALVTLYYSSTKSNTTRWDWPMAGDDPSAAKTNGHWTSVKHHECSWYGITCNHASYWWNWLWSSQKVVSLDLGFLKVDGLLPRELSLLTNLRDVDLHGNDLQGVLPYVMLESLTRLEYLRLHMNGFFGALPDSVQEMQNLRELHLFGNYFAGTLPGAALAELTNLRVLDVYANTFTGRIPTELGKMKQLRYLDLHDNDFVGSVPSEICKLPHLNELIADCLQPRAEVQCDCCTICCKGQMDGTMVRKCVDVKTGKEVLR
jgi:Leucine rich repeat